MLNPSLRSCLSSLVAAAVVAVGADAVAQTLSVWPAPLEPRAAEDGSLTFEYVVVNTGVEVARQVVLSDAPTGGGTLVASTPAASPAGAGWSWALGDVAPGTSARVSVTLDGGGTVGPRVTSLAGAPRVFSGPPVGARTMDSSLDVYLAPTVDADAADPEVLAVVASVGGTAEGILELVADEVAFEAYRGSLRGARGAWWSRAGNAVDQASLAIALLRAAGIPARYAFGTLADEAAAERIASMFAPITRMSAPRRTPDEVVAALLALDETVPALQGAGLLPGGADPGNVIRGLLYADPAADPGLLSETRSHVWVEHWDGGAWVAFDPTGDTVGVAASTSAELGAELRHTVEIVMTVETYNPAFGMIAGSDESEVLRTTLPSAMLEGRPATIAFDAVMTSSGGLVFASTERRYTPLLYVDGELADTGTTFVELATSFPAATTLIMGAELTITVRSPGEAPQVLTHRIADRLGAAARSGLGGDVTVEVDTSTSLEGLSRLDAVTVNVASGDAPPYAAARFMARFEASRDRLAEEMPLLEEIAGATDDGRLRNDADRAAVARAEDVGRQVNIDMGAFIGAHYFDNSAVVADAVATDTGVLAYATTPRVVVVGVLSTDAGPAPRVDLARHEVRVVAPADVPSSAVAKFRTARGLAEAELEAWVLGTVADEDQIVGFNAVAVAAADQGIMLREIDAANVGDVDRLDISIDARAGIRLAVAEGRQVLVPERAPTLPAGEFLVWLEWDPATGHAESVDENGHHMAAVQYATISNSVLGEGFGLVIGGLVGFSNGTLLGLSKVLDGSLGKFSWSSAAFELAKCIGGKDARAGAGIAILSDDPASLILALMELAAPDSLGVAKFIGGFSFGACLGTLVGSQRVAYLAGAAISADPPLPQYDTGLIGPLRRPLSADRVEVSVETAAVPAVAVSTVSDWRLAGSLELSTGGLRAWGEVRLEGTADVRDDVGVLVSSGAFTASATELVATGATALAYDGDAGLSDGRFVGSAFAPSGSVSGTLEIVGAVDGGAQGRYVLSVADVTLTGGPLTFDADGGEITVAGGSLQDAQGAAWSGVSGTVDVATTPALSAAGAFGPAADYLAIGGVPASVNAGVGARLSVPVTLSGSVGPTATLVAEGPIGWDVSIRDGAVRVVVPAGAGDGPWHVHIWGVGDDGALVAGATAEVVVGAGSPGLEVVAEHAPLYTTFIGGMLAPSVVSIDVRNAGPEPVSAELRLVASSGFVPVAGLTTFPLDPGESGGTLVAVVPVGAVPAPGTAVALTATVTAAGAEASDSVEYAFPVVTGTEVAFEPAYLRTTPGTTIDTEFVITSSGNATRDAEVLLLPSEYLDVDGLPGEVSMTPGATVRFPVTVTVADDAPLGFVHGIVVDLMVGEIMQGRAPFAVRASSPGATKIVETAELAEAVGETALADALLDLAGTFERLELGCDTNLVRELEYRLRATSVALHGDDLALLAGDLWDEADELADAGYTCDRVDLVWICDVVLQIADVLGLIDDALGAPVLVRSIDRPAVVRNGDVVTFDVTVENTGDEVSVEAPLSVAIRQSGAATPLGDIAVAPLEPGATRTYGVEWDTAGGLGTFVVSAVGPRNSLYDTVEVLPAVEPPAGNLPPVFGDAPPGAVGPGESIDYVPAVTDPDGDAVFLAAPVLPPGLRFVDGAIVGSISRVGVWGGVLVAQDRYGAATTLEFEIDVAVVVDNEPPVVTSRAPRAVLVDVPVSYAPRATDPDGDEVTWSLDDAPDGATLDAGALAWTPSVADVGRHWFALSASDGRGGVTSHRFALDVRESPLGPDLVVTAVDVSGADLSGLSRSGSATVTVMNVGDSAAGASTLAVYEDHDGLDGFGGGDALVGTVGVPALDAGETATLEAALAGEQAFPGSLVWAHVDADAVVAEEDETNNTASHVGIDAGPYHYAGFRPTDTDVVLVAPAGETAFRVIDPATGEVVHEGVLERELPTWLSVTLPGSDIPLDHFVVEADQRIQVYVYYEIFAPNFGGDMFHPTVDGARVGREFALFVPTLGSNNVLVVTAVEPASLVVEDIDGATIASVDLGPGQWWEPTGVAADTVFVLRSTGDVTVQSVAVTGASAVPPADASLAAQGDLGREFVFSTRSRGSGGGAVAVFAYEDSEYTVLTNDGFPLVSGSLAAGELAFHPGLGERRGARLAATGLVAVMSGDIARAGAETIGLMGEDITQWVGDGGLDLLVHTQEQTVGRSVVLAGPLGASLDVDGASESLGPFGVLELRDDALVRVSSTTPVVAQVMGGGDRYFDYGTVLRRVGEVRVEPAPVLARATIDTDACAAGVFATVRLGNAGGTPLPATTAVELVALSPDGESVAARIEVGSALAPGRWVDLELDGVSAPTNIGSTWLLRVVDAGPGAPAAASFGATGEAETIVCRNEPPQFVSTPPTSVVAGTELLYVATAEDPEGGQVHYALVGGPAGTSLRRESGLLRWLAGDPGTVTFAVQAIDAQGDVALQAFDVRVTPVEPCTEALDTDADGWCAPEDCAEGDPAVHPGAIEVGGDGVDNDCDALTTDVVTGGGLRLLVTAERETYAPGETVVIEAAVGNESPLVGVSGLEARVAIACPRPGPALHEDSAEVDVVPPSGEATVVFPWTDTEGIYGPCAATVSIARDATTLLSGTALFAIETALTGTLVAATEVAVRGDEVVLDWTVDNGTEAALVERVTVRADGWPGAFADTPVTVEAGGSADGQVTVDTASLAPAAYRFALRAGTDELAEAHVAVMPASAELAVPQVAVDNGAARVLVAPASPLTFRPRGPLPGGEGMGGIVRAVWTDEALWIALALSDVTDDADDEVDLFVSADGARIATARWTRGAGLAAGSDGTTEVEVTEEETVLIWTLEDEGVLALEAGRELGLRVETSDGPSEAVRDGWAWASGPTSEPSDDGMLVLVGRDVGPGEDAGVDAGGDAGTDATVDADTDAGWDADAETDTGRRPPARNGGCACNTGADAPGGLLGLLLVLAVWWLPRRAPARRAGLSRAAIAATVVAGAAWLAACGNSTEFVDAGADTDAADAPQETGAPDTDGVDAADGGSDAGADATPDVGWDTGSVDVEPLPGLGTGQECEDDADCASGICQDGGDYRVCTQPCDLYPCPEGFSCEDFPGGTRICVAVAICIDEDNDGYGRGGACAGADCNDGDVSIHEGATEACNGIDDDCDGEVDEGVTKNACGGCGEAPAEVCNGVDDDCDELVDEEVSNACGTCGTVPVEVCNGADDDCDGSVDEDVCPDCDLGASRSCYGGPEGTAGVGICVGGVQRCQGGGWTVCLDQVLPEDEVCNGIDDDCDGEVDEGVLNACGACGPAPVEECNERDDDCDGEIDEGVQSLCGGCTPCGSALIFPFEQGDLDPSLAPAPDGGVTLGTGLLERHDIWVPNSLEGSVSRWDTRTGRELGRYFVGTDPSRTAVDLDGNVWVGHRGDGLATHIYSNTADCIDRNGDGVIQTSRDLNGDGRITGGEVVPEAWTDPLADECIHCQVRVGNASDLVRGVGVDADNYAWLGTWNSREVYKVDPETCEIVAQLPTVNPTTGTNSTPVYGLAIDPDGQLWTSSFTDDCIVRVDTREARVVEQLCYAPTRYGIAVGADGRVWYGGYGTTLVMYDPATAEWSVIDGAPGLSETTGIVAANDGRVFVAGYSSNHVGRYDPATGEWALFSTYNPPPGFTRQTNPRGVTIDAEGDVWAICRGSSGLVEMTQDGEWLGSYDIVNSQNPANGTSPYSYSDNTGFQLFNVVASEGTWRDVLDLGADVQLVRLEVDAHVPEGTSVEVEYRAASSSSGLDAEPWQGPTEERMIDLRAAFPDPMRVLEVRARLVTTDPAIRPVLRDVRVLYETADCRLAGFMCPSGQVCDRGTGACTFLPRDCFVDAECGSGEYCDGTGLCRDGCRLEGSSCSGAETCDPVARICGIFTAECADDTDCEAGSYCASTGYCAEGCRLDPDTCPSRFACDATSRECLPLPPECALDDDCPAAEYCGAGGRCLRGCRVVGTCAPDQLCDADARLCVPEPDECVPADPPDEMCNGVDDDCDGAVDESVGGVGVTCTVGLYLNGTTECHSGRTMCRVDPVPTAPYELVQDAAIAPSFSSQTQTVNYSASRATGPSDVTGCAASYLAWRATSDDATAEFIELEFAVPVRATGVRIHENFAAPFVTSVDLVTEHGTVIADVWTGTDETACGDWLELSWPRTDAYITGVIVHTSVVGREEIDAVQLIGQARVGSARPLGGTLTDVILTAGDYVSTHGVNVSGNWVVEPGVSIDGGPGGDWTATRNGNGDTTISGAELRGVSMNWARVGDTVIEDTVMTGKWGGSSSVTFNGNGRLHLLGVTVLDLAVEVSGNVSGLIEFSRFESTDNVTRWSLSTWVPTEVYESEFLGRNIVPRRTFGVRALGSGRLVIGDSELRRFQTGFRAQQSTTYSLERVTVADSDSGLELADSSVGTVSDVHLVGLDVGHTMLALWQTNASATGSVTVDGLTVSIGEEDRGFLLDPDFFRTDGASSVSGVVFTDAGPEGKFEISGQLNSPTATIVPMGGGTDYALAGTTGPSNGTTLTVGELRLYSRNPDAVQTLYAWGGGTIVTEGTVFEDVTVEGAGGSTIHMTGGSIIHQSTGNRNLMFTAGVGTVTGTHFESRAPVAATLRRNTGAYAHIGGSLTITGATFQNLNIGVATANTATLSVSGSHFENYAHGAYLQHTSQVDGITDCTFVDGSADIASIGVHLRFDNGGRAVVTDPTFDIGAEDTAIAMEPDCFQVASPSEISGVTYVEGRSGKGIAIRGDSSGGSVVYGAVDGVTTFTLIDHVRNGGGTTAVVPGSVSFVGVENAGYVFTVQDAGSTLDIQDGATFTNVELQVGGGSTLNASGVTLDATGTWGRNLIRVWGTAIVADSSFTGNDRRQTGIRVENGAIATATDSFFVGLEDALLVVAGGDGTLTRGEAEDCWRALRTYSSGAIHADGTRVVGGYGSGRSITGLWTDTARSGLVVDVANLQFDIAPEDIAFTFETWALSSETTIGVSGSTFVGGEQGQGYRLHGTTNDLAIDFGHVEPAQTRWLLIGAVNVQGAGSADIPAGTAFAPSGTYGEINARGTTVMNVGAAYFYDTLVRYYDTSTGTVDGATFEFDTTARHYLLQLYSTGAVTCQNSTFRRIGGTADLRGVFVSGTSAVTPSILNNLFDGLTWGIYVESGPVPIVSGNTFVSCTNDTFGL